jgi:hypothetical protein
MGIVMRQGNWKVVALIGHITLFETKSDAALVGFTGLTQKCSIAHTVLSEADTMSRFHDSQSEMVIALRGRICRELLLEKRVPESLNLVPVVADGDLCGFGPDRGRFMLSRHSRKAA